MKPEGQYFAPISESEDGDVVVELAQTHPGFLDDEYRKRRNAIAALALGHVNGEPIPVADYTDQEHDVWRVVLKELAVKHHDHAVQEYLDGADRIMLPTDRVPQLGEVSDALAPLTGFRYEPAAGLVPLKEFYGDLADNVFHSTQYLRHHSVPFYTPEPDIIHEVVGHANALANDRFAAMYRLAGDATQRVESQQALEFVSKVFWFTLEFGVMGEGDDTKAYGAGILSSFGELDEYRGVDIRPLNLTEMGTLTYDITHYQDVLFRVASFDELEDVVGGFWRDCDDESIAAMIRSASN